MADNIEEAIGSVLAQTFQDFEIIIIDDGSSDDTVQRVMKIQDQRIRLLCQENLGPSAARNAGIVNAKGSLIALLDADDLWLPTKLAKQVDLFRKDPNLGIAYCGAYEIDNTGRILREFIPKKLWPLAGDEAFKRIAYREDFIIAPLSSMIIRKKCFNEVGLFDEQIFQAEDWEWAFRIAYKWNIGFVPEPLVQYRMTGYFVPGKRLERQMQEAHLSILERGFGQFTDDADSKYLKHKLITQTLWSIAFYWYAVGKPEKAQENIEQITNSEYLDFRNPEIYQAIAYIAFNLYDTITPIHEAISYVKYVFAHLPRSIQVPQGTCNKIIAETCAICAFDSTPRGEILRVWEAVMRTIFYAPGWIKNRGLLILPFRVIGKKLNRFRVTDRQRLK